MTCQHCGTEISDKAIVCFRCGQSTSAPSAARPDARRRPAAQPLWLALTALLVLVAGGLYMARAASGQLPASVSYTVAALAAVVLVWRILKRRRT
ncbi:MAG: zinc-ribbon domain-containing protein [Vicinamibacterales bacterium]|nr:zinc-ribbon domain-containing protein [Vicinamibacterales bacterium]